MLDLDIIYIYLINSEEIFKADFIEFNRDSSREFDYILKRLNFIKISFKISINLLVP